MHATALAHPNIALVKYWGKRDSALNLPRQGSLSLTLEGMVSRTTVELEERTGGDEMLLDGRPVPDGPGMAKVRRVLGAVRKRAGGPGERLRARIVSANDFPTGAGLASSASGLAALATAAAAAAGLVLDERERSVLARMGSGSACRSIVAGFAEWRRGEALDGSDSYAVAVAPVDHWDVRMLVAVVESGAKAVSSTAGMEATRTTSPYFEPFLASIPAELDIARRAVLERDLEALGTVMERNCLRMHAAMLGASPPLLYLKAASLEVVERVWALRRDGVPCWFTIDAGPNVKVLCEASTAPRVREALLEQPATREVLVARPGPGAYLEDDAAPATGSAR